MSHGLKANCQTTHCKCCHRLRPQVSSASPRMGLQDVCDAHIIIMEHRWSQRHGGNSIRIMLNLRIEDGGIPQNMRTKRRFEVKKLRPLGALQAKRTSFEFSGRSMRSRWFIRQGRHAHIYYLETKPKLLQALKVARYWNSDRQTSMWHMESFIGFGSTHDFLTMG